MTARSDRKPFSTFGDTDPDSDIENFDGVGVGGNGLFVRIGSCPLACANPALTEDAMIALIDNRDRLYLDFLHSLSVGCEAQPETVRENDQESRQGCWKTAKVGAQFLRQTGGAADRRRARQSIRYLEPLETDC